MQSKLSKHLDILTSPTEHTAESKKPKPKTKAIYDYKKADMAGLIQWIKEYDFENTFFLSANKRSNRSVH